MTFIGLPLQKAIQCLREHSVLHKPWCEYNPYMRGVTLVSYWETTSKESPHTMT